MYPRNAASPERIAIGAVVQISDGAVQTSGVSIAVIPQGGASGAGGGTTAYDNGVVLYTPTQAETNYSSFIVTAYKTGCIPVSQTIVTSKSDTAGYAGVDWGQVLNKTTTNAFTGTTIAATQKVDVDTIKTQTVTCAAGVTVLASVGTAATSTAQTGDAFARLGAPAGASVSADVAALKVVADAILDDTGTTGVEIAANAVDAAAISADAGTEIAAAVLGATVSELASLPGASPTLTQAIALLYMALRNKRDTDSAGGTDEIHNDAGTVVATATVSDSGTLFTKGKYA